jgi:hypothetical protein
MATFWGQWARYMQSCAKLMPDISFGWALISSEQTNSFLLQQQKSTLLQIGTKCAVADKKTQNQDIITGHTLESVVKTFFFPKLGFKFSRNLCLCGQHMLFATLSPVCGKHLEKGQKS